MMSNDPCLNGGVNRSLIPTVNVRLHPFLLEPYAQRGMINQSTSISRDVLAHTRNAMQINNLKISTHMGRLRQLCVVSLLVMCSLSGCFGKQDSSQHIGDRGPDDVVSEDYNVLYIGHSFGRGFAELLEELAHIAGVSNHRSYIEFSGGESGTPGLLWEDEGHRSTIKSFLDTGEIDVLVMICCSPEFVQTQDTDQAMWNFTEYALNQNPNTRIGLAMPWKDFPSDYSNSSEHQEGVDEVYASYVQLSENLSSDFSKADVFTFHHGAIVYELREMFEEDQLKDDVKHFTGSKVNSLFTDEKGHAGQIIVDTGSLIWLYAVHGIEPMEMPVFSDYEADIRQIAQSVLDEEREGN